MKLNKLTLIAALALGSLVTMSPGAKAQDASTNAPAVTPGATPQTAPPARRGRMLTIEQMTKVLALTDEQKTNVQTAMQDQRQKMADLRQDSSLSTEDRRAKMKDIRDAMTAKMKEILTPEQFTKYQAMMPARRPAPPAAAATGN